MNYTDLATRITARLVDQIETGPGTWRMPWHTVPGVFDVRNAATGNHYRGANTLTLAVEAIDADHPTGWWATYKQWADLDAQVRKGERSARIVKSVPAKTKDNQPAPAGDDDEETRRTLVPRVYSVFNAAQVDGWTPPAPPARTAIDRHADAETLIANTGAQITYGHHHAAYQPARDRIELPAPEVRYNREHHAEPLPTISLHALRHGWATVALEAGVPMKVVQDRLNHASERITADIYTHVRAPLQSDAAERVAGLILPNP